MLDYEITGPFDKDRKLMEKRHKNIHKLRDVMRMLIQEIPLLPKHKNHPLHKATVALGRVHTKDTKNFYHGVHGVSRRMPELAREILSAFLEICDTA